MEKRIWNRFKQRLQRIALGISGIFFKIVDIATYENQLGYTAKGNAIHLAPSHSLMEGMSDVEKMMFIQGVFAHELMHQLNTDFVTFNRMIDAKPWHEKQIFQTIFNIMEDPAIEYHAHRFFGGELLRALHYSIAWIYKKTPEIDQEADSFSQFLSAAIQYGDGGFLKGRIADETARDCFSKALPWFDKTIVEPNGTVRLHNAQQVFELTKPLWEPIAKNAEKMEEFLEKMKSELQRMGKDIDSTGDSDLMEDGDFEEADSDETDESSSRKMKRREIARTMVGKEVSGMSSESSSKSDKSSDSESSESSSSGKSSEGKDDMSEESDDKEAAEPEAYPEEKEKRKDSTDEASPHTIDEGSDSDEGDSDLMDDDEVSLSAEEVDELMQELADLDTETEIEDLSLAKEEGTFDAPELDKFYSGIKCINMSMSGDFSSYAESYNRFVKQNQSGISLLTNQLKRMLRNARDEKHYKWTGRLSVKRLQQSRMTTRVFTKRTESKRDVCVMLVIDVSGSMSHGNRIEMARKTAIGLAEVFGELNIPFKVMTFTGEQHVDGNFYDVVHRHYINWKNTPEQRLPLLSIRAEYQNFDGYSIRYAAQVLKKRKEEQKLMIVVSDGRPECSFYHSCNGIADTKNAIKEASKYATVIGAAIGADRDVLYEMYGTGFVNIHNLDELFEQLGKVIKKEIGK